MVTMPTHFNPRKSVAHKDLRKFYSLPPHYIASEELRWITVYSQKKIILLIRLFVKSSLEIAC
jgi:hypothetical protein